MKKLLLVVSLTLSLGGCQFFKNVDTAFQLGTASVSNPVTKTREAQIELAVDAAIDVLRGYKRACVQGTADKNCRANIAAIRNYTVQIPPLLAQLRGFVDNNDQVNAVVVYNQLTALYTNVKNAAAGVGYNVGALP